ncbi:MAG: ABC transporter substrate-binding protein [Pararhodobacter sp.]|nr:ABC transporter substrate-binding protein [Pararhodobacter sp.]
MRTLTIPKTAFALCAATLLGTSASADEVRLGILLGFTGPLESITQDMARGAELAIAEVNAGGNLLGGQTVRGIRADSTCLDSGAATAAAERLITSDRIAGLVGADCSGISGAILQNVARPNGMVMISPSATSPALSSAEDDGLFFRTAASDARQGEVMADVILDRGITEVAVSYSNTDYGKGMSDSFRAAFEGRGGTVTISASHEDGRADYSADIGTLAAAGGEVLAVIGYLDQGGRGVIRAALDAGAFDSFVLPDGMVGEGLVANIGTGLDGSFGQTPGSDSEGAVSFADLASADGFDGTSPFAAESYDAAALILLAMQSAGSADPQVYKDHVLRVANAPGEPILPGELARGLEILAAGGEIDYVGASAVELIGTGESAGNFREIEIVDGTITTVRYR